MAEIDFSTWSRTDINGYLEAQVGASLFGQSGSCVLTNDGALKLAEWMNSNGSQEDLLSSAVLSQCTANGTLVKRDAMKVEAEYLQNEDGSSLLKQAFEFDAQVSQLNLGRGESVAQQLNQDLTQLREDVDDFKEMNADALTPASSYEEQQKMNEARSKVLALSQSIFSRVAKIQERIRQPDINIDDLETGYTDTLNAAKEIKLIEIQVIEKLQQAVKGLWQTVRDTAESPQFQEFNDLKIEFKEVGPKLRDIRKVMLSLYDKMGDERAARRNKTSVRLAELREQEKAFAQANESDTCIEYVNTRTRIAEAIQTLESIDKESEKQAKEVNEMMALSVSPTAEPVSPLRQSPQKRRRRSWWPFSS